MKKNLSLIPLFILLLAQTACVGPATKMSEHDVSHTHMNHEHQTMSHSSAVETNKWNDIWTNREMQVLNSLSLYNATPHQDKTNRVVNNPDAAKLGKKLFFDKRFSADGTVACASCHQPERYFTDGLSQAVGLFKTSRNTPTIVGASNNNWYFLDGRTDSLWSQALHPIENPLEHRSSRSQFAKVIFNDAELKKEYEKFIR